MPNLIMFIITASITAGLSGCVITYMDKPLPSRTELWEKPGSTDAKTRSDIILCSKKGQSLYPDADFSMYFSYTDYCMLRKGYEFNNNPSGRPWCINGGAFWGTIACHYHRDNITRQKSGELTWRNNQTVAPEEFMLIKSGPAFP